MQERRRTEADSPEDFKLGVAVRTADGSLHPGRIALVSNERVTIAFPIYDTPEAEQGYRVKLLFRSLKGGELTAIGRLVEMGRVKGGERHCEFCFEATTPTSARPKARRQDPADDNRRQSFRVKTPRRGMEVTLRPYGDPNRSVLRQLADLRATGEQSTVRGWVHDLSADGMGVICEDKDAHLFGRGDHIDVTFRLPGRPDSLMIGAHVRHQMLVRLGARYGLRFDQGSTAHFQRVQAEVLEYVMQQQREILGR